MILSIFMAIFAINILVLVHELGHFIAGRRLGMEVEIFSIGFGPKIIGFKYKGIEYKLSLILIGGYVKFLGDECEEEKDIRTIPGGFFSVSPWARIIVCFAGGFCNILLAFILYTVIFYEGKQVPEDMQTTVIGWVAPGSVADKIGIIPGDKIVSINSERIKDWQGLLEGIALSVENNLILEINRDDEIIRKETILKPDPKIGIKRLGVLFKKTASVNKVIDNSPADIAGLLKGDKIVAVNNKKTYRFKSVIKAIRQNTGKKLKLTVVRNHETIDISIIPSIRNEKKYGTIGCEFVMPVILIYPKPWEQFWHDLSLMGKTLSSLVTRRVPVKAMSGPVGIVGLIGISAQMGFIPLISIIALISLNLGVINLLPIPVLDGGHILFTLIEVIRKKPLSFKTMARIQNVFITLLLTLFLYITYNDVLRWFIR